LTKDEDDPEFAIPQEFVKVKKDVTEEDLIEEQCCHGEAMGDFQEDENMLNSDKSLKAELAKARQEMKKPISKRSSFTENREKLESYYRTNIDNLIENRSKLANARERFEQKRIERMLDKELIYEADPFKWDLVKDKDGKTKIRILGEDDPYKDFEEKNLPDEETLITSCSDNIIVYETEKSVVLNNFVERKEAVENFFKSIRYKRWIENNAIIQRIYDEDEMRKQGCSERYKLQFKHRVISFRRTKRGQLLIVMKVKNLDIVEGPEYIPDPNWWNNYVREWGAKAGAIFEKRFLCNDMISWMQKKVDALEIKRGFPKFFWQYCIFTPTEYEAAKKKYKREMQARR
jgi:hypothetical protein